MTETIPKPDVLKRYVAEAEALALKHDGKIPHVRWLRRNGHANLDQYMRAHPKAFGHLQQHRNVVRNFDQKAKKRQVKAAKFLARRNNGNLPSVSRLMKRKKTGLLSYMNKHPHFFNDIPQDRKHRTKEEHVAAAEGLAEENGGDLPGGGTIVDRGGWALYKYMERNKSGFLHIPGARKFLEGIGNGNGNSTNGANKTVGVGTKAGKQK